VKLRAATGFTLIEMVVVIAIGMVLTGMAIPVTINALRSYRLTSAVSAATGAIQSTRYSAIMHGYPYEITFIPATDSYQIYTMIPPATTYSPVVSIDGTTYPTYPIPITGSPGEISISRAVTYQFVAGGTVTETSTPMNLVFQITSSNGGSNTITVSGVGNVSVSTP
jgi:prepilin-type N-terminal cleavage/methylation domain-containing protein